MFTEEDEEGSDSIVVSFSPTDGLPNMVAVTGETGSGKSLLVAKAANLLMGGKARTSMVALRGAAPESHATVQMKMQLSEPHLSCVEASLQAVGLDPSLLYHDDGGDDGDWGSLVLTRILTRSPQSVRLKSLCQVNGHAVTAKALKRVAAPLLAIVDTPAASAALSKPSARLAVMDTAIAPAVLARVREAKTRYRECRQARQALERDLEERVLPSSFRNGEEDDAMLQHWVEELDSFEERMTKFRDNISALQNEANDEKSTLLQNAGGPFLEAVEAFVSTPWIEEESGSESSLYGSLLEVREAIKTVDFQINCARQACEALSSLSEASSAASAVEQARKLLFDSTGGSNAQDDPVVVAAEKSHEVLNTVEEALAKCVRSMEDTQNGLLPLLEQMREGCPVSVEDIDMIVGDWNVLARKHQISPYALAACHKSLRQELDGNVEARLLLPKAIEAEAAALSEFEAACQFLSDERGEVAARVSEAVTRRMPSLGMESSRFQVQLNANAYQCTSAAAYGVGSGMGVDTVDFLLLHDRNDQGNVSSSSSASSNSSRKGGKLDVVGSAGERARILLALETELPGSVGASCGMGLLEEEELFSDVGEGLSPQPPVAVIYDEIDAHMGGRAAVAVAKLLSDQTRGAGGSTDDLLANDGRRKGQVICITHNPSVAAIADQHVVVEKAVGTTTAPNVVQATCVEGAARRRELARMASGDLATEEAETFAEALIRDGDAHKQTAR